MASCRGDALELGRQDGRSGRVQLQAYRLHALVHEFPRSTKVGSEFASRRGLELTFVRPCVGSPLRRPAFSPGHATATDKQGPTLRSALGLRAGR
jgi:hypothetical protein